MRKYLSNPDNYKKHIIRNDRYRKSEKGKITRDRAKIIFDKRHPGYWKQKGIEYRKKRKLLHLCIRCGKENITNKTLCQKCLINNKKYQKYYNKLKKINKLKGM